MDASSPAIVDKGPREVSRSMVINAPVETLFEIVVNPHRHHEWDGSGTVGDRVSGPERMSEGDRFTVSMKMFGIPYRITSTATEIVPNQVVEWQHPGGHRWRYEFESLGPSRTRITETFDYHESKAPKMYEMLGFPKRNGSGIERTLTRIAGLYP